MSLNLKKLFLFILVFGECAKETGLLMPFKCRKEAKELENCLKAA